MLGAVTIGAGSKVGAGSVVLSDLPAYCVAVGIPAKIIKQEGPKGEVGCIRSMDLSELTFFMDYEI